jgi:hypothetical protein
VALPVERGDVVALQANGLMRLVSAMRRQAIAADEAIVPAVPKARGFSCGDSHLVSDKVIE